MAITTELVGTLGGGKVTEIPVNFTSPAEIGTYDVVTVPIPEGKIHRVIYIIHSSSLSTTSSSSIPELIIDGESKGKFYGMFGVSATLQSPALIQVNRKTPIASGDPSHIGTVYYWPIS